MQIPSPAGSPNAGGPDSLRASPLTSLRRHALWQPCGGPLRPLIGPGYPMDGTGTVLPVLNASFTASVNSMYATPS